MQLLAEHLHDGSGITLNHVSAKHSIFREVTANGFHKCVDDGLLFHTSRDGKGVARLEEMKKRLTRSRQSCIPMSHAHPSRCRTCFPSRNALITMSYRRKRAHQKGILNYEFVDQPINNRKKVVTRVNPTIRCNMPQICAIVSFPLK